MLAKDVFPGEPVTPQVCRGPMVYGPGGVPVREVVVTFRYIPAPVAVPAPPEDGHPLAVVGGAGG